MARRKRQKDAEGKFTVSGPFEPDHPVPSVLAGVSCAQTFATRHRKAAEEVTYYVRDLMNEAHARVTKTPDGIIESFLLR